jgi:hypothetical protein
MPKYSQGIFTPNNPEKYIGKHKPKYRSSWEMVFMRFLDENKNITHWASESIVIPYRHPFTGKITNYVPDFFVVYENKNGKRLAEVVEIKPRKQSLIESKAASQKDRMVVAINHAKWQAANLYCKANGFVFRVINEDQIFFNGKR